jgi:hypothetical protein
MHARVARARAAAHPLRFPKLAASVSGRSSAPKSLSTNFSAEASATKSPNLNILRESSARAHER